jgi:hypothetical protein
VRRILSAVLAAAGVLAWPGDAQAQGVPRYDVAVGARWIAAVPLGAADAQLTTVTGGRLVLFETRTDMAAARALEASVGVRVVGPVRVEAVVSAGRSRLTTRISSDLEGAAGATAAESMTEIGVGTAVVTELPASASRRLVPFVTVGARYLRHLHEGRPLVETGWMYHVGGGADVSFRSGRARGLGFRGDLRAVVRADGVFFDDRPRTSAAASASVFFRF